MAAILGHAALDISHKRRLFIKSVLNEEYKDLASSTHEVTDFLFGDNLAKQVKDLNLTNKLSINIINKNHILYMSTLQKAIIVMLSYLWIFWAFYHLFLALRFYVRNPALFCFRFFLGLIYICFE